MRSGTSSRRASTTRRPAVEANGGIVNYLRLVNYDNFAPDVVQLIRTAISQEVDGLVIPNWVPEAEDPAIKDAIAAGIKVILMNAGGADKAERTGRDQLCRLGRIRGRRRGRRILRRPRQEERALRQHPAGRRQHRSALQGRDRRHHRQGRHGRTTAAADHQLRRPDGGGRGDQGRTAEGRDHRRRDHHLAGDADSRGDCRVSRPARPTPASWVRST